MGGKRKLIAFVLALLTAGVLALTGRLDALAQVTILGLLGTYTGGNVAAKFKGGRNDDTGKP